MKTIIKKPSSLIDFLFELYPESPRTRIKKILQNGNIKCNDKTITLHSFKLSPGDLVEVNSYDNNNKSLPFPVLYDDNFIIVVEKPAGISTSSTDNSPNVHSILSQFLKQKSKGKVKSFVVHRLDKEVSGVLLFAKSEEIMNSIKNNWEKTEKKYYALVEGIPDKAEGTIRSWLVEDKSQKMYSTTKSENAKYSITHYKTIKQLSNHTLLDINTETGRKNQIRVHLADIGCPIVGDIKYGASKDFKRKIRLFAYYLSFPHPVSGEKIKIELPMPKNFLVLKSKNENYKQNI